MGDTSFQQMIREAAADRHSHPFSDSNPDMCSEVIGRRGRHPLPPKETALLLVQG